MKALALDGSAALALLLPDERESPGARKVHEALATGVAVHVPAHWWVELTNGVVMAERRKRLTLAMGMEALNLIPALNVVTDDESPFKTTPAVAALARQQNLTAYDAAYLELAIRRRAALASQDKDLLKAALACGVVLLASRMR